MGDQLMGDSTARWGLWENQDRMLCPLAGAFCCHVEMRPCHFQVLLLKRNSKFGFLYNNCLRTKILPGPNQITNSWIIDYNPWQAPTLRRK